MSVTSSSSAEHQTTVDLRDYIRVLRARKWEIGLITVLVVAAALFLTFRETPIYQATAKVLVNPVVNPSASFQVPIQPNMGTERELVLSQSVAKLVKSDLHLSQSPAQLLGHVLVQVVTDTNVMLVQYRDPSPSVASRLANGFAQGYVQFRANQTLQQFQVAAGAVQRRIQDLQTQQSKLQARLRTATDPTVVSSLQSQLSSLSGQLGVLQQRLLDVQAGSSSAQTSAEVVQPAETPGRPVSPNKKRNALLALLVGLALGIGWAFLRERLDDRLKSREELERRIGAPVLAAVPKTPGWRKHSEAQLIMRSSPRSPISEAYRTLSTNIQYAASQQPLKVIMVTSSMGGEGKTTTSANLAIALAQAGRRVILVSADLRRPRLHKFFEIDNSLGLTNILADGLQLSMASVDVGIPNLRLINAGPVPNNPAELLGSVKAVELVETLRDASDFVIIDTPPVLAVADSSVLASMVDGTLFILNAESSGRAAIVQARVQMENAGANLIGVVFNNFDPSESSTYPYYYSYYYQYYGSDDADSMNGSHQNGGGRPNGRRGRSRSDTKNTLETRSRRSSVPLGTNSDE